MATTCGVSVTKNADGTYKCTSSDATNGVGWVIISNSQDVYNNNLNAIMNIVSNEILRQILQITTIG